MDAENSIASFGPNWPRVALLIGAALAGYAFGQGLDASRASIPSWAVTLVKFSVVALPLAILCWLLTVRLSLDAVGLHYRSLFGQAEMRWEEVDELYVGAVTTLLYGFIPLGTRYRFRLKSGITGEERVEKVLHLGGIQFTSSSVKAGTAARQLSFGSRFSRAEKISDLLNKFTFPELLQKATQQYNSGVEIPFGDFRVSRRGVKFDLLGMFPDLMKEPIPWADVLSYSVEKGRFTLNYTTTAENSSNVKRDVADIANFRVMLALLQLVKPQSMASAAS